MKPSSLTTCLATCLLWIAANPVFAISFGSIADWAAAPDNTISIDDKNFVWLADSGNWTGVENVNLAYLPAVNAHGFGIETLESYTGPLTLSVSYRIDITSSNLFAAVGMDQDFIFPNVTTYKDVYFSEASFNMAGLPGTGTVALSITNFTPSPTPPVALPAVQSIWVRDTIVLDDIGVVQSISNTFVQAVPEPSSVALAVLGIGLAAALPLRLGASRRARSGTRRSPVTRGHLTADRAPVSGLATSRGR